MKDVWESDFVLESFSLFLTAWPTVFLALGCPFYSFLPPASLPLLSAMNNYQQHLSLLKMNMKAKFWHSLYHEIKSAANPVFQKLVRVRRCNSIAASWLELTMHTERSRAYVLLPPQLAVLYFTECHCGALSSADVPRVISDSYAVCLGSGNNALLLRAVQERDLGLAWN